MTDKTQYKCIAFDKIENIETGEILNTNTKPYRDHLFLTTTGICIRCGEKKYK
jgi:S-adenosylmethionine synthetase